MARTPTPVRTKPKRLPQLFQCVGLTIMVVLGYYIGRPVYWQLEDRLMHLQESWGREQDANQSVGSELHAIDGRKLEVFRDPDVDGGAGREQIVPDAAATGGQEGEIVSEPAKAAETATGGEAAGQQVEDSKGPKAVQGEETGSPKVEVPDDANAGGEVGEPSRELPKGVRPIVHEGRPMLDMLKRPIWEVPPPEMATPPREEFALRREMIDVRAKDKTVVVTFSNLAFMDFVTTWVRHLTDVGVDNILVGAMDEQVLEALFRLGVPVFDLESNLPSKDAGWGSAIFHKMGREKVTLVNVFLNLGYQLLICDTDMVFLKNPLPYFERYPQAEIFTSSDELVGFAEGEGLEPWNRAWASYNIGILFFRPTPAAREMARNWAELLVGDDKLWDQSGFNDILRKDLGPDIEGGQRVFLAMEKKVKVAILPVSMFCSGHTFFVQQLASKLQLPLYAVHTTFQFAGTPGKRNRLREARLFFDPPEYYEPQDGVITFTQNIPENLMNGGENTIVNHFNLLNFQLRQLRTLFALGVLLNRTVVMPPIWCRLDRFWFEHPGIIPGTHVSKPFLCPMDHIIEIPILLGDHPVEEFGRPIRFKEYSFLDNPLTPNSFKESQLTVRFCEGEGPGCPQTGPGSIMIPRKPSQAQIEALLLPHRDVKVLRISSIDDALGSWTDQALERRFRWRISHILGGWCCQKGRPGHIWYDFFADEKPGWEPKPPPSWQEDHPAFSERP